MTRHRITFLPADRMIYTEEMDTILDAAMKAGVHINASCGGNSSCGKCRVRIVDGEVDSPPHAKIDMADYNAGYRLACKSRPKGDLVVEIPLESQIDRTTLKGKERPLILLAADLGQMVKRWRADPPVFKVHLKLPKPTEDDNVSDFGRLTRELRSILREGTFFAELMVLRAMSGILRKASWAVTVTLRAQGEGYQIVNIEPGETTDRNYSLVVDLGTTTVSAQILDLANCDRDICTLGESSDYNGQIPYGEDVISRIMFSRKKDGGKRLQEAVVSTVNGIIGELVRESGVDRASINHVVFAGNTTMTHLLLGLDATNIMLAPYTPVAVRFPSILARELGLDLAEHARVDFFPCVSSYIGGDIVAGVLGSGMFRSPKLTLFMDVGTNGEIVLGNKEWLMCASCSAGPAFEGGGIEFGLRAEKGAIEQVRINPTSYEPMLITVGREKPKGICGSGLIDCVSELFLNGLLERNGKFRRDVRTPRVREGKSGYEYVLAFREDTQIQRDIVITEVDLDNLIRAKAALYAGCKVLLDNAGVAFSDLERVIIAGGFGHSIDLERAQSIGLLPELDRRRFVFVGNGSLLGARLYSFSKGLIEKAENISGMMTNVELSTSPAFMSEFVAACFLPHTDGRAFERVLKKLSAVPPKVS